MTKVSLINLKDLSFAVKIPVIDKARILPVILIELLYTLAGFMGRMLTSKTFR